MKRLKPFGPENVIIWAGRNNANLPDVVQSDIRAMVSDLNPGSRYLILAILHAAKPEELPGKVTWQKIVDLNHALFEEYGDRFVPVDDLLQAAATPSDRAETSNGAAPRSLRSDDLHLNDEGQGFVASAVETALNRHGW